MCGGIRFRMGAAPPTHNGLHAIKRSLLEKTRQLTVGIHPGQSEEGFFDIMVHLSTSVRRFIMWSVIGGSFESGWCEQPDPTGEHR
jgi:peptidyl-tRNA hydrolase